MIQRPSEHYIHNSTSLLGPVFFFCRFSCFACLCPLGSFTGPRRRMSLANLARTAVSCPWQASSWFSVVCCGFPLLFLLLLCVESWAFVGTWAFACNHQMLTVYCWPSFCFGLTQGPLCLRNWPHSWFCSSWASEARTSLSWLASWNPFGPFRRNWIRIDVVWCCQGIGGFVCLSQISKILFGQWYGVVVSREKRRGWARVKARGGDSRTDTHTRVRNCLFGLLSEPTIQKNKRLKGGWEQPHTPFLKQDMNEIWLKRTSACGHVNSPWRHSVCRQPMAAYRRPAANKWSQSDLASTAFP